MAVSFVLFKTPLNIMGSLRLVLLFLTAGTRGVNLEVCAPAVLRRWVDTKVCAEEAWTRKYAVLRREEATDLKKPLTSLPPFENEQPKIGQIDPQIGIKNILCYSYMF